jgi:glycosyltransferase involved in cell wall biosynthesis
MLLVGKGPHERSLRRLTKKLGLGERAIFTGSIPHSEIPHYATAADLFVFPSLMETQGLVLLVPDQEDAFAEAMLGLLGSSNEARLRALQEQAVGAVQRYAVPAATARLVAVYREAIAAGPRST